MCVKLGAWNFHLHDDDIFEFTFHFSLKDLWVLALFIVIRSQSWRWKYSCDFVGFHVPFIEEYFGSIPSWMIKLQIF